MAESQQISGDLTLRPKTTADPAHPPRDILNMSAKKLTSAELRVLAEDRINEGDQSHEDQVALAAARAALQISQELAAAKERQADLAKQLLDAQKAVMQKSWCDRCKVFGHTLQNCTVGGRKDKDRGGRRSQGSSNGGIRKRYYS